VPERVLVTGGSGTLGRLIVPRLRSAGCEVRVASRRSADVAVDLATGAGLAGAVAGCETILHLATGVRGLYRALHAGDGRQGEQANQKPGGADELHSCVAPGGPMRGTGLERAKERDSRS